MGKKAVLVGCNYPGTKAELHGCVNDVWRMHKSLIERFGFDEHDITVLIDTDRRYTEPTGANIKRAVDNMISESEPGDVLVFHYSGHGTRLPAETGESDDTGYDECIVPCDMNLINDEDMREFVDKLPQEVTLTIVSDSCHSGGLIAHEKEQIGDSFTQHGGEHGGRGWGGEGEGQQGGRDWSFGGEEEGEGGGWRGMLKQGLKMAWDNEAVREAVQQRFGGLGLGQQPEEEDDEDRRGGGGGYGGGRGPKNRALSMETLLEILRDRTGRQDLDVGSIRPTLYDMFGDDSSVKVKKFVKVMLGRLQEGGGGGGGGGGMGMLGSLAAQFLQQKLDENGEEYGQAAQQVEAAGPEAAYAGSGGRRMADMGILVSGCQSDQTSADANPSGDPRQAYGALSNAVQMILAQHDGPLTNQQVVTEARRLLASQGFTQRPGLYCSDPNVNSPFIC